MKVALFITCLADTYYPRVGVAVTKVLRAFDCEVEFPSAQTCCGQPMWNNGFSDETKKLARQMARVFSDYQYVVTPSGSCAAMIREYYPQLFNDDLEAGKEVGRLAEKTFEFVEFLTNVLKVDLRTQGVAWSGRVTYHYSCHLRGLGMTDEAVRLMQQIEGLELVRLKKEDQCCGFGGTFAVKYPQISGSMVRDKVECIRDTGSSVVVSNDSGCTLNMAGACRREKVDVAFISLAEIIAEGMGLLERNDKNIAHMIS